MYQLEEIDRTPLKEIYTSNYLKKFIFKDNIFQPINKDSKDKDFSLLEASNSQEGNLAKDITLS